MKRIAFAFLALALSNLNAHADETVQSAQKKLKADGFYHGQATGTYDSATSAAVTRFQIRHGLVISGKLDAATTQALGIAAASKETAAAEPAPAAGTWRRLRDGDMQFLKKLNSGAIPPPNADTARVTPTPAGRETGVDPHAPPPRLAEDVPTPAAPDHRAEARADQDRYGTERLRDYVGAFVLAGLDPAVGAELEFFADRVDYFGEKGTRRDRIRRDLLRYDRQWPQRQFTLAGELKINRLPDGTVKVAFPLRYDLRNGHRHASGEVMKTLLLRRNDAGELEISGVNERKF
jgi:Putative peptidoglycan binding domain